MQAQRIAEGLYAVGAINPTLRVFDIIMPTAYGTTYNAYLLTGEKNVLIETVHADYAGAYLEKIASVLPVSAIDYVILNHTEPDHAGSLGALLDRAPNATVIGSAAAVKNLGQMLNRPFPSRAVKTGDTLPLGDKTLHFYSAPNLHWPDSMFTWCPENQTLFTCDFLGAHYCEDALLDKDQRHPDYYRQSFLSYYGAIFSPFKRFVLAGLAIIDGLPGLARVCPSHGPILTETIPAAMAQYRALSTETRQGARAAVVYVSAYGYTRALAQAAREALEEEGVETYMADLVSGAADMETIGQADLLLFGSPTINRSALKPILDVLSAVDAVNTSCKKAAAFGSFGWSGEAVPMLTRRLAELKYKTMDGFAVTFAPTETDLANMKAFVTALIHL